MSTWRGWKTLVHDAVDGTTDLVAIGHASTARRVMWFLERIPGVAEPARDVDHVRNLVTTGVLDVVRGVNRGVRVVSDLALDAFVPESAPATPVTTRSDMMASAGWLGDAAQGAVNGVIGDRLTNSSLDLGFSLRWRDRYLGAPPTVDEGATSRIVVFVHGLATTEWSWWFNAEQQLGDAAVDFGARLERDHGMSPVYARYNTGRHISDNGRAFAEQLDALVSGWPVPVDELVLVGHSMGGLVARSATHAGLRAGHRWVTVCRRICCIGSPHRGAPLERFAHGASVVLGAIDLPGTQIPAEILRIRSAGIRDLHHGSLDDAQWASLDPDAWRFDAPADVELLDGIAYAFLVGTLGSPEHPMSQILGDGMVLPESAGAGGPDVQVHAVGGVAHATMQTHPGIYEHLERFCAG